MQNNLRLLIWTVVGILAAWFIVMSADLYLFLHTDIDEIVYGTVAMNRTDIGERCGAEYINSPTLVDYKLNTQGQMVYLCPLGISPLRNTVVAITIPDAERRSLNTAQQIKINSTYPSQTGYAPPTEPMNPNNTQPQGGPARAERSIVPAPVFQGQQQIPAQQQAPVNPVQGGAAPVNQQPVQQPVPVQPPPINQTPTPQTQVPQSTQPPINQTPVPQTQAVPQTSTQPPINQTPAPQMQGGQSTTPAVVPPTTTHTPQPARPPIYPTPANPNLPAQMQPQATQDQGVVGTPAP